MHFFWQNKAAVLVHFVGRVKRTWSHNVIIHFKFQPATPYYNTLVTIIFILMAIIS